MENKKRYYLALSKNSGRLNELDLGEILGFEDNETMQIITQLLSEHKIEYYEKGRCNYIIMKGFRGKNRKVYLY
ncbi:hypothetical protein [Kriegella aquimaris]|uniref:Winged helix-turn-helix domain n=1 Tax=Kriegella aquimaris TaxID=192904 RepID=A0A1G9VEQ5_9FLAO|nr:hypothetical protein [Kriegella aquimaris]SDM70561.1 hypothetical protein SAMN04488514_11354 [Kriegella aquimaris]